MAIYSAVPPPEEPSTTQPVQSQTPVNQGAIDIEAWTVSALQSLSVSPVAQGTGTPLAIPLDEPAVVKQQTPRTVPVTIVPPVRPPSRRDSQRHRDALLKGKEGSRQRRRWENDRLMGVPGAVPPSAADWEIRPTHRAHHIPYQMAQFWDHGVRQRIEEKTSRLQAARKKQQRIAGSATGLGRGEVPRDLRETAKRTPAVRTWVKALEEPIRQYIVNQQAEFRCAETSRDALSDGDEVDSEDEEIVFVGRKGALRDLRDKSKHWKPARREVSQETVDSGMMFDSFGDDEGAAYRRWLTHAICDYYGLQSKSITVPNPSRRVVYVGIEQTRSRQTAPILAMSTVPRPLWQVC